MAGRSQVLDVEWDCVEPTEAESRTLRDEEYLPRFLFTPGLEVLCSLLFVRLQPKRECVVT